MSKSQSQLTKWKIVLSLFFSNVVDILLSAKTTLPTFLTNLGAPAWMLPLLVPIRESGALLPQALLSRYLADKSNRQRQWQLGVALQSVSILLLIGIPYVIASLSDGDKGFLLGGIVLLSLTLLSLARALTSLTIKDIQGEHTEKGQRGNLVGISSTVAGLLSLLFGITSFLSDRISNDIVLVIGIISFFFMIFSMLALVGVKTTVNIEENKSRVQSKSKTTLFAWFKDTIASAVEVFQGKLGRFILVRSCFVHTALVAPFFIVWALEQREQSTLITLSAFIMAQAAAAIISSYAWGKLSDINAKLTMQIGALLVFVIIVFVVFLRHVNTELLTTMPAYYFVILYFLLSMGHEGARAGRKVYALDIESGAKRTDFIGKANTTVGLVLLTLGATYSLLSVISTVWIMPIMAGGLALGLGLSLKLSREK